jgi:hypothetical protein
MNKKQKPKHKGAAGVFALNQHTPRYAHRATKRNRTRADQRRHAIQEG